MRLHPGEWRDSHNKWSLSNIPIAFPNEEEERYVEQIQLLCREVRQSEKDPSLQRFGLGLRKPNEIQKTNSGTQSTNPESNIGTNLETGVTTPVKSTQHGRTVQTSSMPLPSPFMSRSSVQTGAEQDQVNIYLNTKDHPTLKVLDKAPVGKKEMETFCKGYEDAVMTGMVPALRAFITKDVKVSIDLYLRSRNNPLTSKPYLGDDEKQNYGWMNIDTKEEALELVTLFRQAYDIEQPSRVHRDLVFLMARDRIINLPITISITDKNVAVNWSMKMIALIEEEHYLNKKGICRLSDDEQQKVWKVFIDNITSDRSAKKKMIARKNVKLLHLLKLSRIMQLLISLLPIHILGIHYDS
jgi:hypothetical protein